MRGLKHGLDVLVAAAAGDRCGSAARGAERLSEQADPADGRVSRRARWPTSRARVLGNRMGQILGQQVVVENKPGAGSNIAAEYVARAPKDGYTLFLPGSANIANAAINPKLPFDIIKDFAPIALVNTAAVILVVHPSLGVNSVKELIALAKSKPGELSYASTGRRHRAAFLRRTVACSRPAPSSCTCPIQGSPQAVTDLLAGRVQMMFSPASTVIALVQGRQAEGCWRPPARKRAGILPDVPTMDRSRHAGFRHGDLVRPDGARRHAARRSSTSLSRAVREAVKSDEVMEAWRPQGVEPLDGGPDDLRAT